MKADLKKKDAFKASTNQTVWAAHYQMLSDAILSLETRQDVSKADALALAIFIVENTPDALGKDVDLIPVFAEQIQAGDTDFAKASLVGVVASLLEQGAKGENPFDVRNPSSVSIRNQFITRRINSRPEGMTGYEAAQLLSDEMGLNFDDVYGVWKSDSDHR